MNQIALKKGIDLNKASFVQDSVGEAIARFHQRDIELGAISDISGGIYKEDGLDILDLSTM